MDTQHHRIMIPEKKEKIKIKWTLQSLQISAWRQLPGYGAGRENPDLWSYPNEKTNTIKARIFKTESKKEARYIEKELQKSA